jgi:hypothetical protein
MGTNMKGKNIKARASVERLFSEPFQPQWMTAQEEAERHALDEFVSNGVDQQWRRTAEESRRRIADVYPSKKRMQRYDGLTDSHPASEKTGQPGQ